MRIFPGKNSGKFKPAGSLSVDRAHPSSRNLKHAIINFNLVDEVGKVQPQMPPGERTSDVYGTAFQKDSVTTTQWEYPRNNDKINGSTPRTYMLVMRRVGSYGNARILDFGGSGSGARFTVRYDTGNALRFEIQGTGYTSSLVPSQFGEPFVLAIRSTTDQISGASLFLNGIKEDCSGGSTVINTGNTYWRLMAQTGVMDDLYACFGWDRALSDGEIEALARNPYEIVRTYPFVALQSSAVASALTGTITASINEGDITAGGETAILTLTGDTWVAAGATFDAQRQNIIDGFDAASSPTNGWNNEVRDKAAVTECVRTSDTVVTLTWAAQAGYNITSQETITATIPATALVTSASAIVATPTFTIDPVAAGRIMGGLAGKGGLAGYGGLAGKGGGMAN